MFSWNHLAEIYFVLSQQATFPMLLAVKMESDYSVKSIRRMSALRCKSLLLFTFSPTFHCMTPTLYKYSGLHNNHDHNAACLMPEWWLHLCDFCTLFSLISNISCTDIIGNNTNQSSYQWDKWDASSLQVQLRPNTIRDNKTGNEALN